MKYHFPGATDYTTVTKQSVANGFVVTVETTTITNHASYPYEETIQVSNHCETYVSDRAVELWEEYLEERKASRFSQHQRFAQKFNVVAPRLYPVSSLIRWMAKALIGGQKMKGR